MKILIATGIYPPQIGGPATYTRLMEEFLPKYGVEVSVESFGWFLGLPKGVRHLVYLFQLFKKARKVDIVFAQDTGSVGFPSLIVSKMLRKKFLVRVAGDYAWEQAVGRFGVTDTLDEFQNKKYAWRVEFLKKMRSKIVEKADIVITPSFYFQKIVSRWVSNPQKVKCIYNGIREVFSDQGKEEARGDLSLNQSAKILIGAGRMVKGKGFDTLLLLLENLQKESKAWFLILLGSGPELQKIRQTIEEKKLQNSVLLPGAVSKEKLFQYLCASDIFVLNTVSESFSFQVVEAMRVGIPVVTTNVGSLPELIENGKEGILVPYGNMLEMEKAVRKISEDVHFRENLVKNAREKSKQFSIEKTASALVELIKSL